MNQRIRELLEQATVDALFETRDAVDLLDNPVTKQQRQLQLEKFAELIVRDVLNIVEGYCETSPEIYGLPLEILEHFDMELPVDDDWDVEAELQKIFDEFPNTGKDDEQI